MLYKEFGIYTNNEVVCIIVEVTSDEIIGVNFPIDEFVDLSNKSVNNDLLHDFNVDEDFVFKVDYKKEPDFLKNCGYLGQLDKTLQSQIKSIVIEVLDDLVWFVGKTF